MSEDEVVSTRDEDVEHFYVNNGHVRLHVASAGPTTGTPVVLLHGFPEYWWSWRYQIDALAKAGFRVYAPDLRGYNDSDKPRGIEAYKMANLIEDVATVIRGGGHDKAHVVAHDWGGAIGWSFAAHKPELTDRLVILNAPHPRIFSKLLRTRVQFFKSWYIFFFQLPFLPENRMRDPRALTSAFRGWSRRRERFDDATMDKLITAFRKPHVATSAINYYRAALWHPLKGMPVINAKTLVLWGEDDRALDIANLDGLEREVKDVRVVRIPNASHWVQQDAAERVNQELIDFLR